MKYLKIIFICSVLLSSCENAVDDNDSKPPIAVLTSNVNISKVGNYCILDASKCSKGGGDTLIYNWEADVNNPSNIFLYSWKNKQQIGFIKEGIYKFRLTINNGKKNSNTVQVAITVGPRDKIIFEDPTLEIHIRYALNIPNDGLTNENLLLLDSLSNIYISTGKISSLKGIENCKNLSYLLMSIENIANLTPLTNLINLKKINLDQNWMIKDISPLKNLTNLQELNLQGNIIEDISALENLTQLKYLNMMENPIKDLSPLGELKKLEELWLDSALDGNLTFISELKNLNLLWMTDCNVKDILPLKDLTNLQKIDFDGNGIIDLSPLNNLNQLEWLYLDKNQVTDITPIESLDNLSRLRLWNNQIKDIHALINNKGLGEGDDVGLFGNPLNDKSVNEYIPALRARGVTVEW